MCFTGRQTIQPGKNSKWRNTPKKHIHTHPTRTGLCFLQQLSLLFTIKEWPPPVVSWYLKAVWGFLLWIHDVICHIHQPRKCPFNKMSNLVHWVCYRNRSWCFYQNWSWWWRSSAQHDDSWNLLMVVQISNHLICSKCHNSKVHKGSHAHYIYSLEWTSQGVKTWVSKSCKQLIHQITVWVSLAKVHLKDLMSAAFERPTHPWSPLSKPASSPMKNHMVFFFCKMLVCTWFGVLWSPLELYQARRREPPPHGWDPRIPWCWLVWGSNCCRSVMC